MTEDDIRKAIACLSEYIKVLTIAETGNSIDSILNRIEVCAMRDGIKAFVLDPWNEIDHNRPAKLSETEYISQTLSRLRNFARIKNLACFVVAHPTKLQKDPKTGLIL